MKVEQLQVRILLQPVQGATIAYFYNRESFDLLNIERNNFDKSQLIEIGNTIEFEGEKYVVKNINFKMEQELYVLDNSVGINMHSPTDPSDYNCQIGVFVDNS
ncbi:MAG: hypothetical protein IPL08_09740 [Saprospiraceae bacterium]|nr:hypothetical protein [Saprospiraceae bacterium]MBK8668654.1 hypothetical protein [Saprospiraceae bacterium]MBL0099112.1 hypothetical protein [Saprospiraceae bacterium]MBP7321053.1 hypothetical protein [Lachnospiraceae bacterium]